jgi:hypothetical protein
MVGVGAAAAGRFYVGAELLSLRAPVIQQRVGAGQGGSRAEKNG